MQNIDWKFWIPFGLSTITLWYFVILSRYFIRSRRLVTSEVLLEWRVSMLDILELDPWWRKLQFGLAGLGGIYFAHEGYTKIRSDLLLTENLVFRIVGLTLVLGAVATFAILLSWSIFRGPSFKITSEGIFSEQRPAAFFWRDVASFRYKRPGVFEIKWGYKGFKLPGRKRIYVPAHADQAYELFKTYAYEEAN